MAKQAKALELNEQECKLIRASAGLQESDYPDERIRTIYRLCCRDAENYDQIAAFLRITHMYQLDPMVGQAGFGVENGDVVVITGRDTFLAIAERRPTFRGIAQGVIRDGDFWEGIERDPRDSMKVIIHHTQKSLDGQILGGYCVAYDAERPPIVIIRSLKDLEHLTHKDTWKKHLADMVENNPIGAALRRMYSLSKLLIAGEEGGQVPTARIVEEKVNGQAKSLAERLEEKARGMREHWTPDLVILKGKYKGRTWADMVELDPTWLKRVATAGQILDNKEDVESLRGWLWGTVGVLEEGGDGEEGSEAAESGSRG